MQSGSPAHPIFIIHLGLNGFGTLLDGSPLTLAPLHKRAEYYTSNPSIIFFHVFLFFLFFLLSLSWFLTSWKNRSGIIAAIKSVPRRTGSSREQGTPTRQESKGITLSSSLQLFLIYFASLKFQFKVYWRWGKKKRMKKGEVDEGMHLLSWCVEAKFHPNYWKPNFFDSTFLCNIMEIFLLTFFLLTILEKKYWQHKWIRIMLFKLLAASGQTGNVECSLKLVVPWQVRWR